MTRPPQRMPRFVERLRDVFDADLTKLLLSTLIILSVIPLAWIRWASMAFFAVFAVELSLRVVILHYELRQRSLDRAELVLLALDILATLSFLPLEGLFDVRYLRLLRLSRMLMLLSYWSSIVREIWIILIKRERRYQLAFVASLVIILTFSSAILLYYFRSAGIDFNENGSLRDDPRNFWAMVWWSFRQLQDPGNLLKQPAASLGFFFSVALTMSGIFVIAFTIGIGTSVVEELVQVGRERRIGMRDHSVIGNLSQYAHQLVSELVNYYAKTLRPPRLVTLGRAKTRYDFMYADKLRRVRYRPGSPASTHDLIKVDADRARRLILLGDPSRPNSDSEVISQMLSAREVNSNCWLFAELFDRDNVDAALTAGVQRTVPILARDLVSLLIADILGSPGVHHIYQQLLSSAGHEIYTCIYEEGQLEQLSPNSGKLPDFHTLLGHVHRQHGVIALGLLTASARHKRPDPLFAPDDAALAKLRSGSHRLAGLFGVARSFSELKRCAVGLAETPPPAQQAARRDAEQILLAPPAGAPRRVLLCGFHDGMFELIEQLIEQTSPPTIALMVSTAARSRSIAQQLVRRGAAAPGEPRTLRRPRVHFEPREDTTLDYRLVDDPQRRGTIELLVGDWSQESVLEQPPGASFGLRELDTILFSYSPGATDPDARTALGVLKLLRLADTRATPISPDLRVVCEVLDGDKADLFARRFGERTAPPTLAIVSAQRMRHAFLAQSIFVPEIGSIYRQLLGRHGPQLTRRAVARPPAGELDFGSLLTALHHGHGLLPVGIDLAFGERIVTVVNPAPGSRNYRFAGAAVRAVYVVGTADPRAATPES